MAGDTVMTIVGNLVADPELRYTQNGLPVANFTIASTPRTFDRQTNEWKDGDALFLRASVWRQLAEHVAASLTKGMRVIAQGNLRQKAYKDREGNDRTSYELEIIEIGPSLTFATAQVTRAQQGGGQQPAQQSYTAPQGQQAPSWGPPQGVPQGAPQQQPQQPPQQPQYAPQQSQQPPQYAQQPPQYAQQPQQPQQAPQPGVWSQPGSLGDDSPF